MRAGKFLIGCSVAAVLAGANVAQADVVISKKATANMSCSAGVCSPTAAKATLNATDLANMLASGDVKVTTGSGATNIVVKDSFSWTSTSRLTVDAIQSVEFDKPVTVAGTGAVAIATNDGGSGGDLLFGDKGNLTFWDLSSSLVIQGHSYTLVGDIQTLAANIAANPSGFYALANDYDASVDGTYNSAPVSTELDGSFEGLGHNIDGLVISASGANLGLFAISRGVLRDVWVTNASISGDTDNAGVLLAGAFDATIVNCFASGKILLSGNSEGGGLVSGGDGTISRSHADVTIRVAGTAKAGGLVGGVPGGSGLHISVSFATGRVSGGDGSSLGGLVGSLGSFGSVIDQSHATGSIVGGENSQVGGLVGNAGAGTHVTNAYATGAVKGGATAEIGGLAGEISGMMLESSYSTGQVKGGTEGLTSGGFIGNAKGGDDLGSDYWDTETSGKSRHDGYGSCQDSNCGRAIKGLKTETFQAGLPPGFDPKIWALDPNINGGFPYLIDNPPPDLPRPSLDSSE